ncbi:MAG: hypothetical protein BMS9Abin05_2103 [Rhodothermia bacterium]|nr:MAG: hypothetical protein BMS9Abin05_2103 [Rhodothermia bacterium]
MWFSRLRNSATNLFQKLRRSAYDALYHAKFVLFSRELIAEVLQQKWKAEDESKRLKTENAELENRIETLSEFKNCLRRFSETDVPLLMDANDSLVLSRKRGASQHKILLVTIPKSGTYLFHDLLVAAGLATAGIHIAEWGFTDMRFADPRYVRESPEAHNHIVAIRETISLIKPGQFVVGHLPCSQEILSFFSEYRIVFTYRDLRDAITSFMRYMAKNGLGTSVSHQWGGWSDGPEKMERYMELHGDEFFLLAKPMVEWVERREIFTMSYEEIVDGGEKALAKIKKLFWYVGIEADDEGSLLRGIIDTGSFTYSGNRTSRELYWSEKVQEMFESGGGVELNRQLGYRE